MSILKFKSPYTQKEYELEAFEKDEGNGAIFVVSHTALKNLLNVELREELDVKYEVKMLLVSQTQNVAQCTIVDKNGRRTQEIGESTTSTLETPIAKGFPATTAWNRALDRCIIAHLGFKGRVYSTEEIAELENTATQVPTENKNENTAPPARKPSNQKQAPATPAPAPATATSQTNSATKLGDTIVKLARYSGNPQKLSVLWKTDAPMVHWICDNYTPSSTAAEQVKQACIQYRELMKGNAQNG